MASWNEILKRSGRAMLALPLAGALLAGCGDDKPPAGQVITDPQGKDPVAVQKCLDALALGNKFTLAQEAVAPYAGKSDYYVENYCGLLADTQELMDQIGGLVSLIAGYLAPGIQPQTDYRGILEPALNPILVTVEKMQARAELIAGVSDLPEIRVPSLPLNLDLSALIDNVPADLELNLNGRWDRTEALLIAAAPAALLGALDLVLAHKLDLNGLSFDFGTSADIAKWYLDNGNLLALDSGRLAQVGEAKTWFIKALTAAVVTNGGILGSIEAEYADGLDHSQDVIRFVDVDGDKKVSEGDQIVIKVVEDLAADIGDLDEDGTDDLIPDDATITNEISREIWLDIVGLGQKVLDNLNGGAKVSLYSVLKGDGDIWGKLQAESVENGYGELADIADWIALDPKAYFANPKGIRELVFAVATTTVTDGTDSARPVKLYDIAIECELSYTAEQWANPATAGALDAESGWRSVCGTETKDGDSAVMLKNIHFGVTAPTGDVGHFASMAFAVAPDPISTTADLFAVTKDELENLFLADLTFESTAAPAGAAADPIVADSIVPVADPDAHNDALLYIAMQDPSFAGMLHLDLYGEGDHTVATQQTLNYLVAFIWTTYGGNLTALVDDVTAE